MVTPQVRVDGQPVTANITSVSITHGRSSAGVQPDPATCTVDLVGVPADTFTPGQSLTVDAGPWRRFTGVVGDVTAGWASPTMPTVQLLAVDPLGALARTYVGDAPWPVEDDGARVQRILTLAGTNAGSSPVNVQWPISTDPPDGWTVGPWHRGGAAEWAVVIPGGGSVQLRRTGVGGTAGQLLRWNITRNAPAVARVVVAGAGDAHVEDVTVFSAGPATVLTRMVTAGTAELTITNPQQWEALFVLMDARVGQGPVAGSGTTITARDVDRQPALALLQEVAESSDTIVGAHPDGTIYYQHLSSRTRTPTITLTPHQVLPPEHDRGERITTAIVEYGPNPGTVEALQWSTTGPLDAAGERPTVTATDADAALRHGDTQARITSCLQLQADAQALADRALSRFGGDWWDTPSLTVPVDLLPDPEPLLAARVGDLVEVTGVPTTWPGPTRLYVEGWQEDIQPDRWQVTLAVSDSDRFGPARRWRDEPAAAWSAAGTGPWYDETQP